MLVDGHDPRVWAGELAGLLDDPLRRRRMGAAAASCGVRFGWDATVDALLDVYAGAIADRPLRAVAARRPRVPAARRGPGRGAVSERAGRDRPALAGGLGTGVGAGRPARRVRRPAAGRGEAADDGQPDRRRARPVGVGVRRPQAGREPRGRSTAACCSATSGCPGSPSPWTPPATSTSSAGCPPRASRRTSVDRLLGAILRPSRTGSFNELLSSASSSRCGASGAGGSSAASRPATSRPSGTSSSSPERPAGRPGASGGQALRWPHMWCRGRGLVAAEWFGCSEGTPTGARSSESPVSTGAGSRAQTGAGAQRGGSLAAAPRARLPGGQLQDAGRPIRPGHPTGSH